MCRTPLCGMIRLARIPANNEYFKRKDWRGGPREWPFTALFNLNAAFLSGFVPRPQTRACPACFLHCRHMAVCAHGRRAAIGRRKALAELARWKFGWPRRRPRCVRRKSCGTKYFTRRDRRHPIQRAFSHAATSTPTMQSAITCWWSTMPPAIEAPSIVRPSSVPIDFCDSH